jgi:hypothetical protein
VLDRDLEVALRRVRERVGIDERIAVAIAADPRAEAEHRGRGRWCAGAIRARHCRLDRADELGHRAQERGPEERESVLDLVGDPQPHEPQHCGVPQREHEAAELRIRRRVRAVRRLWAVPLDERIGDRALEPEHALPLHLGRVRGEHRHDVRAREPLSTAGAGAARAALHRREGADRRARPPRRGASVLGDVAEVQEVARARRAACARCRARPARLPDRATHRRTARAGTRPPRADRLDRLERLAPVAAQCR